MLLGMKFIFSNLYICWILSLSLSLSLSEHAIKLKLVLFFYFILFKFNSTIAIVVDFFFKIICILFFIFEIKLKNKAIQTSKSLKKFQQPFNYFLSIFSNIQKETSQNTWNEIILLVKKIEFDLQLKFIKLTQQTFI